MTGSSGRFWFGLGMRCVGLILLASMWGEGCCVLACVRHGSGEAESGSVLLLAMLAYISACLGAALTIMGRHLFDRVAVSARWTQRAADGSPAMP